VLVKPLVNLIWIAGLVFLAGALVAMWPSVAEQRRLAERYRELRTPARA
jgi:cytochrome c biogenesis factor